MGLGKQREDLSVSRDAEEEEYNWERGIGKQGMKSRDNLG